MIFTIEPMVNLGRPETKTLSDDWTAVTVDKSLSAQFEHSIGVSGDGCDIFTLSPGDKFHPTFENCCRSAVWRYLVFVCCFIVIWFWGRCGWRRSSIASNFRIALGRHRRAFHFYRFGCGCGPRPDGIHRLLDAATLICVHAKVSIIAPLIRHKRKLSCEQCQSIGI